MKSKNIIVECGGNLLLQQTSHLLLECLYGTIKVEFVFQKM